MTPKELPATEPDDARMFWANHGIRKSYTQDQHWRGFMAGKVLAYQPRTVVEFGCNVGRNLLAIRDRAPSVDLLGIDINAQAVAYGRKTWNLPLVVGDERVFAAHPDNAFDVLFTVSVLDHIADPDPLLAQMARVAKVLLLLEPWLDYEGKVPRDKVKETSPFSYSWDLPRRLGELGLSVEVEPYPLTDWGMGPDYRLHIAVRS